MTPKRIGTRLTWYELFFAGMVGNYRASKGIFSKKHNDIGYEGYSWATHANAAHAECAFAKVFNVYWPMSVDTFEDPDVAGCQVRHTAYPNGGLIVRPRDEPKLAQRFYLVSGSGIDYSVAGWLLGSDVVDGGEASPRWVASRDNKPGYWCAPWQQLNDPLDGADDVRYWPYRDLGLRTT